LIQAPNSGTVSGHVRLVDENESSFGVIRASLWDVAWVSIVDVDFLSVSFRATEEQILDWRDESIESRALNLEVDSRAHSERRSSLTLPIGQLDISDAVGISVEARVAVKSRIVA
jgi:hypothetical protein